MQLSNTPGKLLLPFAADGSKNVIPVDSQIGIVAGKASLADGFPPLTRTPLSAGGVPPSGLDMNGILFEMSAVIRWANAGGGYAYDAVFAADTNVNGYPKGARIMRSDGLGYWFNTVENNTTDPEAAGAAAAGWVPDFTSGATAVTVTNANVTLTPLQYGKPIIVITGALTANLNLIFPAIADEWVVINNATGAFSVTCKTAAGTGATIPNGSAESIYGDGTNIGSTGTSFIQAGAGAVARTMQAKAREIISIKDFGAKCDGATNDTAAIQAAISAIGSNAATLVIPGPTKVNAALTFGFGTELDFYQGGMIIGTAGTELIQIQKQIDAGPRQIFSTCAPRATTGQTVFPEWFGAKCDGATNDQPAFTAAISYLQNTGGVIQMQPGTYAVSSQIQIPYNRICMQGAGNNITYIKALGATVSGIGVYGVAGVSFVANVMLRDFSLLSSVGGTANVGLDLQYTAFVIVERMQIQDFIVGLQMLRATNSQVTKVGATYTGATNGFVGFNILGGGTTGGNASSILKDCYSSGMPALTGQIGFQMTGVYMSDFQFDNCETAVTNYGYYLDYQNAPDFNEDIIVRNPIVDRFTIQGILVNRLPSNGSLSILGGWSNPATTGAETDAIYLDNCAGLLRIADHQFCADTNYANATGVRVLSSIGYKIGGCTFKDQKYGVRATSSGYGSVTDSLFKNANGRTATAQITGTADARTMVNGCTFDGYATQAVIFDATSSGSGIVNCNANVANISTRFTNGASGAIGGATGSTGNNSGV